MFFPTRRLDSDPGEYIDRNHPAVEPHGSFRGIAANFQLD